MSRISQSVPESKTLTYKTQGKFSQVEIVWSDKDVPRIQADNYESLGFGYGYAHARDRLIELVGQAIAMRGLRSRYYGPEAFSTLGFLKTTNLNSDLMFKLRVADEWVKEEFERLNTETQDYISGYANGLNYFVDNLCDTQYQQLVGQEPMVRFNVEDIVRFTMRFGVMKELIEIGPHLVASANCISTGATNEKVSPHCTPVEVEGGFGSNAWAYGGDVVEGDSAILVGNPHSAWQRNPHQLRIYMHQCHLTIPGELDVAGTTFLGFPLPLTGYNADVSWSILDAATVTSYVIQYMEVNLKQDSVEYLMDGKYHSATIRSIDIETLQESGDVIVQSYQFAQTHLGTIFKLPQSQNRPAGWYAITNPGERNAKGLDQFLSAAKAGSTKEFIEQIEQNRGVLCQLVVADKYGDVGYVVAGNVPPITDDAMASAHLGGEGVAFNVLDGSQSKNSFRDQNQRPLLAAKSFYPNIISRGIIHNTNNSYKYSEFGKQQPDYPSVFGQHKQQRTLAAARLDYDPRLIMSYKRMQEISSNGKVTARRALEVVFDNRNYAAETFLDWILTLESSDSSASIKQAFKVLANWDRKNNSDSRGALLFHQLWGKMIQAGLVRVVGFGNPEVESELSTTLQSQVAIVEALEQSVSELEQLGFALDTAWGSVLYQTSEQHPISMHGGSYEQGILNGEMPAELTTDGFAYILFGTAYLQLTQWQGSSICPQVLLAHGQRDGVDSLARTCQLKMFLNKELYPMPYYSEQWDKTKIVDRVTIVSS
ncbi:penicillin acylase family protein [Vibrio sp. SCSIO 43136]|uniref:penicillin acylase family protein n=1 Tax=Vibrio sp. SCSIO 43136 TaxID=2819101 RepID=UPI002076414A|nr:penicillin acylase family protein [Vibrio sp. SCSIO 43136]USD64505.1 penicillin acylase family protein [Vibrio sp. SCSIO 43136]